MGALIPNFYRMIHVERVTFQRKALIKGYLVPAVFMCKTQLY